ncbi:Hypothetical protein R9X50_00383600 [Acrodontium crateriforme]|uniref:Dystroglycan n=1 Tax=Acrodontium crateriforme TaxID=150365 RepID=A0AAQ3M392_9PEZI|nr:Hypothetical protein R9X50_00383600 [Acrodontium crateriforme]
MVEYSGATASFIIEISQQQLGFVPEEQTLNITSDKQVNITSLKDRLFRDGVNVQPGDLTGARTISMPTWLKFDPDTLDVTGTPPSDANDATFEVLVSDGLGDTAVAMVNIVNVNSSLFLERFGPLTAYVGQMFTYSIPDKLLREEKLMLSVKLPATATWLSFDDENRELQGIVPAETSPTALVATITAKSADTGDSQSLELMINVKDISIDSPSPLAFSFPSKSSVSEPLSSDLSAKKEKPHLSSGAIAVTIILSVMLAAFLIASLVWCSRLRKRKISRRQATTEDKERKSRPINSLVSGDVVVESAIRADVKKIAGQDQRLKTRDEDRPPQITLDWLDANGRSTACLRTSHINQALSTENGEDAIGMDSEFPDKEQEPTVLSTPHDSFSGPTTIARLSMRASQLSPTKRTLQRRQDRRESSYNTDLETNSEHSTHSPRHSLHRNRSHQRGMSSSGSSPTRTPSTPTSRSIKAISMSSTKELLQSPVRSLHHNNSDLAISTISNTETEGPDKIQFLRRSASVADTRPLTEKRQSFVRHRASTTHHFPLFSHVSQADSSSALYNPGSIKRWPIASASEGQGRPGKSGLTVLSESSSVEPHAEDNHWFIRRIQSSFAPNFPRTVKNFILVVVGEQTNEQTRS